MTKVHAQAGYVQTRARRNPLNVMIYLDIWRQRRQLARLTPAQRDDMGISADAAQTEVQRPIWDVPACFRK